MENILEKLAGTILGDILETFVHTEPSSDVIKNSPVELGEEVIGNIADNICLQKLYCIAKSLKVNLAEKTVSIALDAISKGVGIMMGNIREHISREETNNALNGVLEDAKENASGLDLERQKSIADLVEAIFFDGVERIFGKEEEGWEYGIRADWVVVKIRSEPTLGGLFGDFGDLMDVEELPDMPEGLAKLLSMGGGMRGSISEIEIVEIGISGSGPMSEEEIGIRAKTECSCSRCTEAKRIVEERKAAKSEESGTDEQAVDTAAAVPAEDPGKNKD